MSRKSVIQEIRELLTPSRRERLVSSLGDRQEHPDPTPNAAALNFEKPQTMEELIQRYVRMEVSAQAEADGFETWEEADDFEPEDPEELPFTPYVLSDHQLVEELPLPDAAPPLQGTPPEDPPGPPEAAAEGPQDPSPPSEAPPDKHPE